MTSSDEVSFTKRVWAYAKFVLGAAAYGFVAWRVARDWDRVSDQLGEASIPWLGVGLVFGCVGMALIAVGWRHLLTAMGHRLALGRVTSWYFIGELWKYLPGGIWPILGRGELARQNKVPRVAAYSSVMLSLALLYMAGMVVTAVMLPFELLQGDVPVAAGVVIGALPASLVALHPKVVGWAAQRVRKVKPDLVIPVLSYRQMLGAMVQYAPSWIFNGLTSVVVAYAVVPGESSWHRIFFAALISWIFGFLVFFLPAGAGVRESVFVAASGLSETSAITVAVVARLIFVVADVGGAVIGRLAERRHTRSPVPAAAGDTHDPTESPSGAE